MLTFRFFFERLSQVAVFFMPYFLCEIYGRVGVYSPTTLRVLALIVETKIRRIFLLSKSFFIFIYCFKRLILRGFIGDYI